MPPDPIRPTTGGRIPVKLHRRVCLVQTEDAVLAEELLARKKLARLNTVLKQGIPKQQAKKS